MPRVVGLIEPHKFAVFLITSLTGVGRIEEDRPLGIDACKRRYDEANNIAVGDDQDSLVVTMFPKKLSDEPQNLGPPVVHRPVLGLNTFARRDHVAMDFPQDSRNGERRPLVELAYGQAVSCALSMSLA